MGAPDNDPRRFVGFELELTERRLIRDGCLVHLEPRAFDTLAYLAGRPGRLVRKRELIEALWPGVAVTDNALTRCIAEIRKALADDARSPRYIQTVPRLGYRFVGKPAPAPGQEESAGTAGTRVEGMRERRRHAVPAWRYAFGVALVLLVAASTWLLRTGDGPAGGEGAAARVPPRSIAVLPFLNLSEDPGNSYLADGLSENLLDLLASIPDVKVVARSSSFAFRGRNVDARTIGEALGVAWLLEASVQRENDRIRVEAEGFLRRALELEPTLIEAHNWLAGVLSAAGRYREAREQREAALALDPLNPVLLVNQSMMKRLHGDYDGAVRAANRLLLIPYRPGGAYWQMAQTQGSFGHLVVALDNHAKAVRELEPPNRLFHIGAMAVVLARLGLPDDARLLLERLRALDPEFSTDYRDFNVLVRSGQRAAAGRLVRGAGGSERG